MRNPKYIGTQSGDWTCTFYGINYVQPAFSRRRNPVTGKPVRNKCAGHRQYYYVFERRTSDNLADKSVRLNAYEMLKVSRGKCTVEQIADARAAKIKPKYVEKVNYCYCV
jgi:hypothetical protein